MEKKSSTKSRRTLSRRHSAKPRRSRSNLGRHVRRREVDTIVVASDIHFPKHNTKLWESFVAYVNDLAPDKLVLAGDIIDLGALSRFPMRRDENLDIGLEFSTAVREIARLEVAEKYCLPGNHESRWRGILADKAPFLKNCLGLSLADQFRMHGLNDVRWVFETPTSHGLFLGHGNSLTLIRHGDHQFKLAPKHVASIMLSKTPHVNQLIGHTHRAQLHCHTSLGRTVWAISNPTMQCPQDYDKDPNWQLGFTVLRFFDGGVTPQIILANESGEFSA